jgi:uncharacterized alpha-E superfamily protein
MLARIAYQLYWIGRYVSRAEQTARLLDGVFRASLESRGESAGGPQLTWEAMMAAMGATPTAENGNIGAGEAVRSLTLDPESPASMTSSVEHARESAKTVRDVVSAEMWEALNTLYLELDASDLGAMLRAGPYSIYSFVRERCALWWGLADETMLRDQAYAFLAAGRHTEAATMMLRVLRVSLLPASAEESEGAFAEAPALALMRAVGGLQAFQRSVPGPATARAVSAFLIFERSYPHSVAAAIEVLSQRLRDADPAHASAPPLLRLARLQAELELDRAAAYATHAESAEVERLADLLERVQEELELVHIDVERRYFTADAVAGHMVVG